MLYFFLLPLFLLLFQITYSLSLALNNIEFNDNCPNFTYHSSEDDKCHINQSVNYEDIFFIY